MLIRRLYRLIWPRYCDSVCRSRFLYSSACSDHNVLARGWGQEYGYANIYTSLYCWLRRRHSRSWDHSG